MEKNHLSLSKGRIVPLIIKLSIPNAVGLLVVSAYSLADSFFVSALGNDATAAVGVTFSLHVLMQAVGYTLGMGAGSLLSRAHGRGDREAANVFASAAFLLTMLISFLITLGGLTFRVQILHFLGASDAILDAALIYATPLFLSAPAMCGTFVLSQLLRAEGRALYAMVGLVTGSLFNIVLDPILINTMGLGISGASIATLISQTLGFLVLLSAFWRRVSDLDILKIKLPRLDTAKRILITGLPSLLRQGLSGVSAILLNRAAAEISGDAISAISLVTRLFLLVFAFCLGIGQGMIPVVGYNMGAGNVERMKKAFLFSTVASSITMFILSIPLFLFASPILTLFGASEGALGIGSVALRAQSAVLVLHGAITCTILFLQVTGRSLSGTLLAAGRQGIFFLPLIFLLPPHFGDVGLALTQPLSDALTFLLTLPFLIRAYKALNKTESAELPHS